LPLFIQILFKGADQEQKETPSFYKHLTQKRKGAATWCGPHLRQCNTQNFKLTIRRCIQKFPGSVDNEINNSNNNKHSLRSNTNCYGDKTP
jgi:hypothetical protein